MSHQIQIKSGQENKTGGKVRDRHRVVRIELMSLLPREPGAESRVAEVVQEAEGVAAAERGTEAVGRRMPCCSSRVVFCLNGLWKIWYCRHRSGSEDDLLHWRLFYLKLNSYQAATFTRTLTATSFFLSFFFARLIFPHPFLNQIIDRTNLP